MSPTVRKVAISIAVIAVIGAYVWYRASKQKAAAPQTPLVMQPGPEGADGADRGERGAGPDGVDPGHPDPEGQPGLHGPRSEPVCIRPGPATGPHTFSIRGRVMSPSNLPEAEGEPKTIAVAADVPLSGWAKAPKVTIYAARVVTDGRVDLSFTSTADKVYLSVIRTTDHAEFTYVHVGASTTTPLGPGPGAEIELTLAAGETLELVGFSGLVPDDAWPKQVRRTITGTVTMKGGAGDARFLIAAAPIPIVDRPDLEANPSALALTSSDGVFLVSFLADPKAPVFVCALGFPAAGEDIRSKAALHGAGCTSVDPTGKSAVQLNLDASRVYKMTKHEQEHYHWLSGCLTP